ncbi:MAG TPA: peptide chain release factor N(5)-glutamine methyltransferase [Chitinophagaceae bacterium]|jgi:release factor glutamine methyltransferase|nr:peptide chain release factor N(5)-glutamine methyltransferase [Chitinophagaceae bacterium]
MTIQETYHLLQEALKNIYDTDEANNIADLVIEHVTGYKKLGRITHKQLVLTEQQIHAIDTFKSALLQNKPVQYVLQEAWFYEMKFYVNEHVLIPRPETEELIELIIKTNNPISNILDIGTGSGCIPITLKKKIPHTTIVTIDVSEDALVVAKKNAAELNVEIELNQLNFLDETNWNELGIFDIIVSNPPYIKQSEIINMQPNVVANEPHIALFVADDDALVFYRKIAAFGKTHLTINGKIFVEINEALGNETISLFEEFGYRAELKKDMQGKNRMIVADVINR